MTICGFKVPYSKRKIQTLTYKICGVPKQGGYKGVSAWGWVHGWVGEGRTVP